MSESSELILTIDGPAGAGKSTLARGVAKALGFDFLDTGAIYLVATLAAIQAGVNVKDTKSADAVLSAAKDCKLRFEHLENSSLKVILNDKDVSDEIRTEAVTENIRYVADLKDVRAICTELQRDIASRGKYVCEGRDQGTVVFPDAFLKIYLWASPEVRAKRRTEQLVEQGESADEVTILQKIVERDRLDMGREVGGLKKANDAIEVDTSEISIQQAIDTIVELANQRMAETA